MGSHTGDHIGTFPDARYNGVPSIPGSESEALGGYYEH